MQPRQSYFLNERRKSRALLRELSLSLFLQKGVEISTPSCETGSTICAAVLQPFTSDNFPSRWLHRHAYERDASGAARSFTEHPLEAFTSRTSFDLDVLPTEQRGPWSRRPLHSLPFFASCPRNQTRRISLKCIRYARRGSSYSRWKLRGEKTNDSKSIEIREQHVRDADEIRSLEREERKKPKREALLFYYIVRKRKIQFPSRNIAVNGIFYKEDRASRIPRFGDTLIMHLSRGAYVYREKR